MKKKELLIESLRQVFEPEKPLVKMLRTPSGCYLYDTGTNKILGCRKEVYDLMDNLLFKKTDDAATDFINRYGDTEFISAAQEIVDAVKAENILQVKKATQFGLSDHFKDVEEILSTKVQSINLEVTQDCNLRCLYCIYNHHVKGKRNHEKKSMSLDVARTSIDFLEKHSSCSDFVSIGFYGGEPLTKTSFVREVVEYAKESLTDKKILFNITTNATLIHPEMAEYLLNEEFSVLISIDGPKDIHDQYRVDGGGNGSFDKALNGLKILAGKYKQIKKGSIAINMVYAPPYSEKKLDTIGHFFTEMDWLPDVSVIASYPSNGTIPGNLVSKKELKEDKDLMKWALERYGFYYAQSGSMVKGLVEKRLAKLIQRPVIKEPVDKYPLNACCIPGQRKNFITPEGMILICEKMPTYAPPIGNVQTGFDFDIIQKVYIDDYARTSIWSCSRCWGLRLCDICYVSAFNESGSLDLEEKKKYCGAMLNSLEKFLAFFATSLEANPGELQYLYKYELS
jgi:uncharacterized protein